jgi:hypothetical protein
MAPERYGRGPRALMRSSSFTAAFALAAVAFAAGPAAAQSTRLPFTSTFDGGTLGEWDGFRNNTGATVVNQGCQSGSCLRTPLMAGTASDNYGDFYFANHVGYNGAKVEEVWLTLWSKFDSGMTWPAEGHKIVILNLTDGVSSTRRYQVVIHVLNGQYVIMNTDIDNWRFYNRYQNVGTAVAARFNQWDKLKLHVRLNTPGVANGIVQLWVNNQLKADHSDVNIRFNTAFGMNKLILSTFATPSSPSNGVQWHDDLRLSTTDPDGGGGPTAPSAPTNVRIVTP